MKSKLKRIETIASIVIFILAALVLLNIVVASIKKEVPRIFGYSFHLVITDSMTPEIEVGDLVFAKKVDKSKIQVGDDIVFISEDPSLQGLPIIHRVVRINTDGSFQTRGVKDGLGIDAYPATQIIGVFAAKSAFLGKIFTFFSDISRIIFFVVFVVLIYVIIKLAIKFFRTLREEPVAVTDADDMKKMELEQLREKLRAEIEAEQAVKTETSDKPEGDKHQNGT